MSDMNDVRKRIQQRRYGQPKQRSHFFHFFYYVVMLAMVAGVCSLAYLVNDKMGFVDLPKDLKQINFGKISEWVPFEDWFSHKQEDETVNAAPAYTLLKDNEYANGTNQASMLLDGVVLHVEQRDHGKSSATVRHDNGVVATYGHLNTVQIKQDERLKKGDIIGSFDAYVTLDLVKDQKSIDLATALAQ